MRAGFSARSVGAARGHLESLLGAGQVRADGAGTVAVALARETHPQFDTLTDREREILGLVGEGLSNNEIADRLFISPATARTHVGRAMTELAARDRAQLVVFAYQSGLVS